MVMRCSLWLGTDHLLYVKSAGYTEEYSHFYLKDIGGIVCRRTNRWIIFNIIWAISVFLLLFTAANNYDGTMHPGMVVLMMIGIPFTLFAARNLYKGPTCNCQIITSLGAFELPALSRVKNFNRLLELVRPIIVQQQGSIPRSKLLAQYDEIRMGGQAHPSGSP